MKVTTVIDYDEMVTHYCLTLWCTERVSYLFRMLVDASKHRFAADDASRDKIIEQAIEDPRRFDPTIGKSSGGSKWGQRVRWNLFILNVLVLDISDLGKTWTRTIQKTKDSLYCIVKKN